MATSFPTSIDAFTNPTGADPLTSPDHALQHSNVNDAVEAIETAIGTTATPVLARLASPTFTGVPAAPTAAVATNTTQLATTAFVIANASSIPAAQRASTASVPGVAMAAEVTAQTLTALQVVYMPFVVTSSITITSVSVQCDGAGAAGSGARLSIYNSSSSWVPTTLVLDAGTVVLTSTGTKTISSLSTTLPAGNYFFRIQGDNTAGTRPTLYGYRGNPFNWQWLNATGTQYIYSLTATATTYGAAESPVTNLPAIGGSSSLPFVHYVKAVYS